MKKALKYGLVEVLFVLFEEAAKTMLVAAIAEMKDNVSLHSPKKF